jgi:PAS domain S-box-containing protein
MDGRFTYVSPSVQRLRGYTPEEVLQQSMAEVLSPESLRIVMDGLVEIAEFVRAGIRIDRDLTEVEQPCKDGSTVWTEVKTTGVYDDAGRFIGILGVTRDISERRQRDEQLRQLNATLEERVRERTAELEAANAKLARAGQHKDEFLATVSHELRTPLTGILGFSQALEESVYGVLSARQMQTVRLIRRSGEHLLDLINGILDLSRLQVEQLVLHRDCVTVDSLCLLSLRALRQVEYDPPHRITYINNCPEALIEADKQRIVQMINHLLRNAAKFTPPGGGIRLEVQADLAAGCLTLSVSDTGIGIAAGDLPRLFQPFVQLDARLARHYQGAGIGLALVRAIAEAHGGHAGVESTPDVGSRFWVTLPLALAR